MGVGGGPPATHRLEHFPLRMKYIRRYGEGLEGMLAGLQSDRTPIAKFNAAGKAACLRCLDGFAPRGTLSALRLSSMTMLLGLRLGARVCSTQARKALPVIGPSRTHGAVRAALDRLGIVLAKASVSPPATDLELDDPKCSADFSAKPLICPRPMVDSAKIGSKLILRIDRRGIEFVHTSSRNCHGSSCGGKTMIPCGWPTSPDWTSGRAWQDDGREVRAI
jgi:hypothetical protein